MFNECVNYSLRELGHKIRIGFSTNGTVQKYQSESGDSAELLEGLIKFIFIKMCWARTLVTVPPNLK